MTEKRETLSRAAMGGAAMGRVQAAGAPKRSLAAKLFRRTLPVVMLIVLLIQGSIAWITWTDQRRALERRAGVLTDLTAAAIATPLWYLDRTVFEPQVEALVSDQGFRYARVLDDNDEMLFETGTPPEPGSGVITVSRTIIEPQGHIKVGTLEVVFATGELNRIAILQVATAAFAVLLLTGALSITVQFAMRRLVVQPLGRMLRAMRQVEHKSWTTLDEPTDDELGQAAAAFNRMVAGLRAGDDARRLLEALQDAQAALVEKNVELETANRQVMESIRYARRIQEGILPDPAVLAPAMADIALLWEPLDVVGGDYCWMERRDGKCLILLADCTGHGVPGAFMTLVVASELKAILDVASMPAPDLILAELDRRLRARLRQDRPDPGGHDASDDGVDAAVCLYDEATGTVAFAGAGLSLTVVGPDGVSSITGVRRSLGYRTLPPPGRIPVHLHQVRPGESFHLWTDGVTDHVGGPSRRLFGRRRMAALLASHADLPLADRLRALTAALDDWRGAEARRDDMTLVAFRPRLPGPLADGSATAGLPTPTPTPTPTPDEP
ncbi:MAG: serine phosphatase RsbU, regulator of sigma subunit [Tistrella sp.]|nr:SpoIIE family protein phosphatase [Tistrella sp.]MAD40664.1 serine phosphatase RsbU, regulator of sigma subunit [Tistrella sp.]MBA78861.1 serine phosphatase RsbU, regulator of sigma subunit [Tistrella sp.]